MCQVDFITLELTQEQLVSLASTTLGGYMSDHSLEDTSCKVTSGDSRNSTAPIEDILAMLILPNLKNGNGETAALALSKRSRIHHTPKSKAY